MKKILLLSLSLILAAGQLNAKDKEKKEEVPEILVKEEASGEYIYEAIVPVENVSKEDMFKRAKAWVLSSLKTNDNNINADEADLSVVNTASVVLDQMKGFGWAITSGNIDFKLNISFKDGKYKVRLDNIVINAMYLTGSGTTLQTISYTQYAKTGKNKASRRFREMVNEKMQGVASGLDNAIKNGNPSSKKDW